MSENNRLIVEFKYIGHKHKKDHSLQTSEDVVYHSRIINYNQDDGPLNLYNTEGDSFTNIPYIQELSVHYIPRNGISYLSWLEN